jgi:hypothetical protein
VQFNHYGGEACRLAADLVNADWPLTPTQLGALLQRRGVVVSTLQADQAAALHLWARDLAGCFGPLDVNERCRRINVLLDRAASTPRISLHDGSPHLHYGDRKGGLVTHVQAMTSAGLAYLACFASPDRLGRCARSACGQVYVDTSRNGRRAYCTARCGNTEAVSRHRHKGGR